MAIASVGRKQQREGYVLLMTLVLIAVAALSVSGLARRSLLLATESIEAQRQLQRNWGATSCRLLLLDQANDIFGRLEKPHVEGKLPWPAPSQFATQVELAGMTYRLWLRDEDAKLNLNQLTARFPQEQSELLSQLVETTLPLQLTPDRSAQARLKRRWYSSWGQVVDLSQAGDSLDPLVATTASITCWGGGKLNIRRTSDEALALVGSQVLNQDVGRKLQQARAEATSLEWADLVKPLALRRRDELKLKAWFTEKSTCYSLWLELDDGRRKWYHQWVLGDRGGSAQDPVQSFHW